MAWRAFTALCLVLCSLLPAWASDTLKIGAVLSATGNASPLGEPEKNSLIMLEERFNAKGGIGGKMIELVVRYSKGRPDEAAKTPRDLVNTDGSMGDTGE